MTPWHQTDIITRRGGGETVHTHTHTHRIWVCPYWRASGTSITTLSRELKTAFHHRHHLVSENDDVTGSRRAREEERVFVELGIQTWLISPTEVISRSAPPTMSLLQRDASSRIRGAWSAQSRQRDGWKVFRLVYATRHKASAGLRSARFMPWQPSARSPYRDYGGISDVCETTGRAGKLPKRQRAGITWTRHVKNTKTNATGSWKTYKCI